MIFHQKTRPLRHTVDELICWLASINLNPHIICLSEHSSGKQNLLIVNLENYCVASNFSNKNHFGGSMYLYKA